MQCIKIAKKKLKCATMTVEKESQVYEIHKKSRMELGWPIFTAEKERKVCATHKKSRMELRCSIVTVKSVS